MWPIHCGRSFSGQSYETTETKVRREFEAYGAIKKVRSWHPVVSARAWRLGTKIELLSHCMHQVPDLASFLAGRPVSTPTALS